jgi:DNA-binding transcriptional ArsR family regulator
MPASPAAHPSIESDVRRVADDFRLLSQPTRLQVALALSEGGKSFAELVELSGEGREAVSRHLTLMRAARVVDGRRAGRESLYSLTGKGALLLEAARALN